MADALGQDAHTQRRLAERRTYDRHVDRRLATPESQTDGRANVAAHQAEQIGLPQRPDVGPVDRVKLVAGQDAGLVGRAAGDDRPDDERRRQPVDEHAEADALVVAGQLGRVLREVLRLA